MFCSHSGTSQQQRLSDHCSRAASGEGRWAVLALEMAKSSPHPHLGAQHSPLPSPCLLQSQNPKSTGSWGGKASTGGIFLGCFILGRNGGTSETSQRYPGAPFLPLQEPRNRCHARSEVRAVAETRAPGDASQHLCLNCCQRGGSLRIAVPSQPVSTLPPLGKELIMACLCLPHAGKRAGSRLGWEQACGRSCAVGLPLLVDSSNN